MKFKKTKIAALSLAGVIACGALAGCTLVTTDTNRDYVQVIAEVDITKNAAFAPGGEFADYASAIEKTEILKRELVAGYASYSAGYANSGISAENIYEMVKNNLVNRQIYLQYARAYFFKNGFDEKDADGNVTHRTYTVSDYNGATAGKEGYEKDIAGLAYFLNQEEIAKAEYNVKVSINSTLDSQEESIIDENHSNDGETSNTTSSRTTPTGINTENEDYYDPNYKIYSGSNSASDCGSYETQDGSTPASRKKAYKSFLASLSSYSLVNKGEDTTDITKLSYYQIERKGEYESALINKLAKAFENEAETSITEEWILDKYQTTLASQKAQFNISDSSALDSALDGVSNSNYVFYAPEGYGFVINILLPFSSSQSQKLSDEPADQGDTNGNNFRLRASLLKNLTATDQRSAWFSAEYAYQQDGKWFFFEDSMTKSEPVNGVPAQFQKLKNYNGRYPYQGVVSEKTEDEKTIYSFQPRKLTINDFINDMTSYLGDEGFALDVRKNYSDSYFDMNVADYYKNGDVEKGEVDYKNFLYYSAKVNWQAPFDANRIFDRTSDENKVMSIINELSFAYNTDTGGLNSYLGYAVSPNNTDFVKEFEFAAQEAVRNGAGSITVAPSVYGWHIMYCTFSYSDNTEPYEFNWAERNKEGTFSNLYFEALKSNNLSTTSTDRQTSIINTYSGEACVTVYTNRYSDLYQA